MKFYTGTISSEVLLFGMGTVFVVTGEEMWMYFLARTVLQSGEGREN